MNFTIRRARLEDAEAICSVQIAAIRGICRSCYSPTEIDGWAGKIVPNKYADPLQNQILFVAQEAERVVGFSQLDPELARVKAVYVAPDAVHHRVGRALLQQVEEAAAALGIRRLSLDATLNAESFYLRAGYTPIRPERHRVTAEVSLACIHMEKVLG